MLEMGCGLGRNCSRLRWAGAKNHPLLGKCVVPSASLQIFSPLPLAGIRLTPVGRDNSRKEVSRQARPLPFPQGRPAHAR